ncbi:hypothetical protein M9H77_26725 [Catharanthus roseus]|uniref:Uncharacterized protein n=1 Tax=Catharanthus roseus TaxID=4058 RepID=A0ACC0AD72_CATRO|nr:hypothetical protein M9H77_26725 [Catharanthus roseus]
MDLSHYKHLRFFGFHLSSVVCKYLALVITALVIGSCLISTFSGFGGIKQRDFLVIHNLSLPIDSEIPNGKFKFLEVPQIIWGLNNQKIAFARACLTARMLNRTLVMPSLSASLFYKEVDLLQPISFDKVFQFDKFNSLCKGFVQVSSYSDVSNRSDVFELQKGSGRRWTIEKDLDQLREFTIHPYDKYETIRIVGKNPFLWHDHWPVSDYAKVFGCLVFVDEILKEADKVVSKIREKGRQTRHEVGLPSVKETSYLAVHMRIEKDWMIHCKKLELRYNISEICSSKEQIIKRVGKIKGLKNPMVVYLAVADSLLEDNSIMNGWRENLHPFEKKKLDVVDIYRNHPYLIQSAIDYEVCLRSDVFVGNSFSTFSSLVVLDRTQKMINTDAPKLCGIGAPLPSYAYNLQGDQGGPRPWATNMSESNLQSISYGSNHIFC